MTFLDLVALTTLLGVSVGLFLVPRPAGGSAAQPAVFIAVFIDVFMARINKLLALCLAGLLITSFYGLIQRSIEMSGSGIGTILSLLPTVVLKTHYGSMWLVRLAGLSAAGLLWLAGKRYMDSRFFSVFLFTVGAVIAFSRSASGHPADFGDLSPQQIADWFHLLSVASWAGTLLALAWTIQRPSTAEDCAYQRFVADIAERFYILFGPVLAILVMTGLYNAWFAAGSLSVLVTTPYGRMLSAKLALFVVLMLRFATPPLRKKDEAGFAMRFQHRTRFDAGIALGLLLSISVIIHMIPAKHQAHLEHLRQAEAHSRNAAKEPEPVVSLETNPAIITAGSPVAITARIKDPDGKPFKGLGLLHERMLHAVIISKDLNTFAHIHPEDLGPVTNEMLKAADFPLNFTFPVAGEYLIGFDFASADEAYSRTVMVTVAEAPEMAAPKTDFSTVKNFGDYRVTLKTLPNTLKAGTEATLRYAIEKNGRAVKNLEPYLGAAMHLAVVPIDLTLFIHAHGTIPGEHHTDHLHAAAPKSFGPDIEVDIIFPVKGIYKIYSQVKHEGKVLLLDFMVSIR
jgi:putative copper export protein